MKGDFSRFSYNPKKHYKRLLKQQGRVDLDADWNEQADINEYQQRIRTQDIIGPCGVPETGGGFEITFAPTGPQYLNGLCFVDINTGWVVGDKGTILSTQDGGKTWQGQASYVEADLEDVLFLDRNIGWVVGSDGTILHTQNRGKTWELQDSGVLANLQKVWFVDGSHGWVVGKSGTILATQNGGKFWKSQACRLRVDLYGIHFIDANRGWAAGNKNTVFSTTDGGSTWEFLVSLYKDWQPEYVLTDLWFVDANVGLCNQRQIDGWISYF